MYSSETWILIAKDENNLRSFERQILRKIFGPVNNENIWKIRNNMEIDKLIEGPDIVTFINPYATGLNFTCHLIILTLRLLISYIYGAPSKARNANIVYIWTYVWQR